MHLEKNKKSSTKLISDMAIIASDPHLVHFLCTMTCKVLRDSALATANLPRDNLPLQLIIRLLLLGANSMVLILKMGSKAIF